MTGSDHFGTVCIKSEVQLWTKLPLQCSKHTWFMYMYMHIIHTDEGCTTCTALQIHILIPTKGVKMPAHSVLIKLQRYKITLPPLQQSLQWLQGDYYSSHYLAQWLHGDYSSSHFLAQWLHGDYSSSHFLAQWLHGDYSSSHYLAQWHGDYHCDDVVVTSPWLLDSNYITHTALTGYLPPLAPEYLLP